MEIEREQLQVLFTREQLAQKVSCTAKRITEDYNGKNPLIIGVLNGAFMFFADLVREVDIPCEVDFVRAESYSGKFSIGEVTLSLKGKLPVCGRDIIIVEDILDTGRTLNKIREEILKDSPKSVKTAVLFDKPSRRTVDFKADYICFEIPDLFVVGYGLDCDEKYRNLPFVAVKK